MNIIISKTLNDNFSKFVLVDSFRKAKEIAGITGVIIHSFEENDFDAGVFISQLKAMGVKLFVYITSEPSTTIKMVLRGVNGYYFEDEFYFEDEEELEVLINELSSANTEDEFTSVAAPAISVIADFMKGYVAGDKFVQTPLYLEQVNSAINELQEVTHRQELQISAMGNSALEVFEKASAIIKNMDTQRKLIEKQLSDLEHSQANAIPSKASFGNNVMFFSPYKYIGNAKVLLFREYAPTRYLTSFILGYANYLHYVKNRRIKVIFIHQKGQGVAYKYDAFTSITEENKNMRSLYDSEIIATNNPKKEVLKDLLSLPNEIILVVDRLYGSQDILSGRITKVNVASSFSDIARYDLKVNNTIFSVTNPSPQCLFTISTIKQFPRETDARYATYQQVMESYYQLLDDKIGVK